MERLEPSSLEVSPLASAHGYIPEDAADMLATDLQVTEVIWSNAFQVVATLAYEVLRKRGNLVRSNQHAKDPKVIDKFDS